LLFIEDWVMEACLSMESHGDPHGVEEDERAGLVDGYFGVV